MFIPFGNVGQQLRAGQYINARNIRGGIITSQEIIIAGGTQGVIRSQNFDPGTAGWAIFGDGNAEFNDVLIRGDVESGNWVSGGGTSPANLTTRDAGATTGFYLDSSVGAAQFEGNVWIGGSLTVDGTGTISGVIVEGDVESGNWNGASPANLASFDTGATAGFYLDSSVGAAQFMGNLYLDGTVGLYDGGAFIGQMGLGGTLFVSQFVNLATKSDSFTTRYVAIQAETQAGSKKIWKFEETGALSAPGSIFAGSSIQTGSTGPNFTHKPWSNSTIALGTYGSIGSQGSFRLALAWNWERGTNSSYYSHRINNYDEAAGIEFGSTGILFQFMHGHSTSTTSPTGPPTQVGHWDSHGLTLDATGSTSVGCGLYRTSGGTAVLTGGSVGALAAGGDGDPYIDRNLDDIGNQTTLRAARTASTGLTKIGYFSSWAEGKSGFMPLLKSPRFPGLEIIDKLSAVDFKRKSTKQREWGFLLDDFKELNDNLKYVTTDGESWGPSPHETALIAVLWEAVKDLRARLASLEAEGA